MALLCQPGLRHARITAATVDATMQQHRSSGRREHRSLYPAGFHRYVNLTYQREYRQSPMGYTKDWHY